MYTLGSGLDLPTPTAKRAYDIGLLTHYVDDVNLNEQFAAIVKQDMLDDSTAFVAQKQIFAKATAKTSSFELKTFLSTWVNPLHQRQLEARKKR